MATIKDVAKLAGVSASTASRAMHDNQMISEATKDRVRQAMAELNYSPNYSAQNLVKRQSNMVGIVLPVRESQESLGNNPFFMQMIQGISGICADKQQMVSLATGRSEKELLNNIQNLIRSGNIDKFIFLYSKADDPILKYIKEQEVTCVVVGESYDKESRNVRFVDNNNNQASQDATQFLLDKGYEQIVYAYTDMDELVQASRYLGYASVMKAQGLSTKVLHLSRIDEASNVESLKRLVTHHPEIQAFVACDDIMAIRLQRLFKSLGISSRKYAMISFNNSMVTELASPTLTSVDVFPYQLGSKAAEILLAGDGKHQVVIPHQIMERASTPQLVDH